VIYVLNSLRGPATVSTSVQLLIEVNGGPDFELSAPVTTGFIPVNGTFAPQIGGDVFRPQVLGDDAAECGNAVSMPIADTIASSSNNTGGLSAVRFCIGENVVSMRQLLKRSCPKLFLNSAVGAVTQINPFYISVPTFVSGANPVMSSNYVVDYYDVLGSCFAFSRGGVRWKIWSEGGGVVSYKARLSVYAALLTLFTSVNSTFKTAFSSVVASLNVMSGALEVEIPQYTISHMRMNRVGSHTTGTTLSIYNTPITFDYYGDQAAALNFYHYRQGSDDSDFGFFYGVLPLVPYSAAINPVVPW
jgi:hypothetical protein